MKDKPALLTLQLSQATNFVFKLYIRYIIKTTQLAGIHQKTLDKWLLQQQKTIHALYIDPLMKARLRFTNHVVSPCLQVLTQLLTHQQHAHH